MSDIDPSKAILYIQTNAPKFGEAKAQRVYIENYLKTVKANLMAEEAGTLGAKEIYAYSHADYKTQLEALRVAVEQEETLKYMLEAAKLKVEVWKTQQFNTRAEMRLT